MYSQSDEEKYVLEACKSMGWDHEHAPCRFLDIGAWHATDKSNTRALYELGWGGVVIEPSPGPLRGLIQAYSQYPRESRVKVVACAVGVESSLREIRVTDDAVSGSEDSRWDLAGGFYGELYVPFLTVRQIVGQFGGFQMVSIDTEGTSVDVFKDLLAIGMDPRCIVVEHDQRFQELLMAGQAYGYRPVYTSAENVVLVK